eukprot:scaffold1118_cov150-Skeletonema_menzelii.AAC.11
MASRSGQLPPATLRAMEMDNTSSDTDDSKPTRRRRSARSSPANLPDEKVAAVATTGAAHNKAARAVPVASTTTVTASSHGFDEEGCRVCHKDDNHAYLLLCEACNDEYHTYCLNPPLESVPEDNCKHVHSTKDDDGLDSLVSALPPQYTSRIYDPRLTVGGARQLARKNLGKKHLLYFFECPDTPFTVLGDNRLVQWEDGFLEEYDLGKVAKAGGRNRFTSFERALQVAQLEHGKPIEMRMDWNHQTDSPKPKPKKRSNSSVEDLPEDKKPKAAASMNGSSALSSTQTANNVRRRNLTATLNSFSGEGNANEIVPSEDGLLVCKILRKISTNDSTTSGTEGFDFSSNLGFVTLPSRQLATFASIRKAIDRDLDDDVFALDSRGRKKWKFYVPKLGPVSVKQEEKIGPVLEFLKSTTNDTQLGTGIAADPLKVVIINV